MGVIDLDFNLDGSKLLASCMDYSMRVMNTASLEMEATIECEPLQSWHAKFAGDGVHIFTGGDQGKMYYYDSVEQKLEDDFRVGDQFIRALSVSGMGDLAIGNSVGDLHVHTFEGVEKFYLTEHKKAVRALKFTPDGSKVLIASDDLRISLVDLATSTTLSLFQGHKNFINGLTCHPQDQIFASCSSDKTVKVWDMRSGGAVDNIMPSSNANLFGLAFDADGKRMVVGSENGILSTLSA